MDKKISRLTKIKGKAVAKSWAMRNAAATLEAMEDATVTPEGFAIFCRCISWSILVRL